MTTRMTLTGWPDFDSKPEPFDHPCSSCKARSGEPCVFKRPDVDREIPLHAARFDRYAYEINHWEAVKAGYERGVDDLDAVLRELTTMAEARRRLLKKYGRL